MTLDLTPEQLKLLRMAVSIEVHTGQAAINAALAPSGSVMQSQMRWVELLNYLAQVEQRNQ